MAKIQELLQEYDISPRTFSNKYLSSRRHNTEFHTNVDQILHSEYIKYGYYNFSEIFYNQKHKQINNICKICNNKTKFNLYNNGYKKYCSLNCSRSDGTKTSPEKKASATIKRNQKMSKLLNDPIRGKEYRLKISNASKKFMNTPEEKEKRSKSLKMKILTGKFTPNISNSWTHWTSKIDDKCFRSSFEAIFYLYQTNYLKTNIEYEKLRLPYVFKNINKIYIVDFIDFNNKSVYEIKPSSLTETPNNIAKRNCLLTWCKNNNFNYFEITEDLIASYAIKLMPLSEKYPLLQKTIERYKWKQ